MAYSRSYRNNYTGSGQNSAKKKAIRALEPWELKIQIWLQTVELNTNLVDHSNMLIFVCLRSKTLLANRTLQFAWVIGLRWIRVWIRHLFTCWIFWWIDFELILVLTSQKTGKTIWFVEKKSNVLKTRTNLAQAGQNKHFLDCAK